LRAQVFGVGAPRGADGGGVVVCAQVKLDWKERYERDPRLKKMFQLEVLPALSTANVRDLLQAVLPWPRLGPAQARKLVAKHLVNRARSTSSRLKK